MSIRYYDEAVSEKIAKWIKDPSLKLLKPDESSRFFEMKLDEQNDRALTLPLISISRDRTIEILNTQKRTMTFSGLAVDMSKTKNIPLNAVPIQLGYQIDIYTRRMEEADEYLRNFIFNLINYPKVEIVLPYNKINFHHESKISLETTLTDNSDIKEHLFPDQFTRFSIRFKIDDAYLFSAPVNDNAVLESVGLEVWDKDLKEVVEEQVVETYENKS